jgi:deoxycytidylate deaminase
MRKFADKDKFYEADRRDQDEEVLFGQQVARCNYLSDMIISNEKNIPVRAVVKKREFLEAIFNRYIRLIKNSKNGIYNPENIPTVDETLMTIAYAESQRSSCLKRKVGAVIVATQHINHKDRQDHSIHDSVTIIASGHNEVPLGITPCVFE